MRIPLYCAFHAPTGDETIETNNCFRLLGCAVIALLFCSRAGVADEAAPALNLLAIVTDDQARWGVGIYGNTEIRTPHMDRIGQAGAVFTNAFVATPVCSPSRATYFTGLYPTQLGITDWIHPQEAADGLGLAAPTWPQALQAAGYQTAMIGKWHLGMREEFHPSRLGFDEFYGFLGGGNRPVDPTLEVDGRERKLAGPLPDLLADATIDFIDRHRDDPWAVCLHFRAPHLPYGPVPEADSAPYGDLKPEVTMRPGANREFLEKEMRGYYGSISSIDRNVGRVLEVLDERGLTERTIVVFTSDHGYNIGHHSIETKGNGRWVAGGVRGPKRPNMWDTSIRVPLLVRWPGVVEPGTTIDATVSNLDMYRTVLGALDIPVPESSAAQGEDYSPVLRGEGTLARDVLFGQYDLHNSGLAYMRMIRTDRYKLVRHFHTRGLDELYDLASDPGEARNLINRPNDETRRIVADLQARLTAWQESIDDPILSDDY